MEYKDGNPKDTVGSTKVPMSLVSPNFIAVTSLGLLEGKGKYGYVNYRAAPVRATIYIDAAIRHLGKYRDGEDFDSKTLVPHLGNAGACLDILVDAAVNGTLIDDRPLKNSGTTEFIDGLSSIVRHLNTLHANVNPRHWTIQDSYPKLIEQVGKEAGYEEVVMNVEKKPAAKKRIRNRSK